METVYENKSFSWSFLLWGILFILVSLIAFSNPMENILAFTMVFGILAILNGVWFITHRFGNNLRLLFGILEILIGIYLIFDPTGGAVAISIVFALWFILDSMSNLFALGYYRTLGRSYFWFMLAINVLGVLVGVVMFIQPLLTMLTLSFMIGFYFMLAGISYIVLAFTKLKIQIDDESKPA